MKSYTDLPQSKKLAGFLPLESADMGWNVFVDKTTRILPIDDWDLVKNGSGNVKFYHAWSLAALVGVLPVMIDYKGSLIRLRMDKGNVGQDDYAIWYDDLDNGLSTNIASEAKNFIDAVYEMILRLHELNLL